MFYLDCFGARMVWCYVIKKEKKLKKNKSETFLVKKMSFKLKIQFIDNVSVWMGTQACDNIPFTDDDKVIVFFLIN